MEKLLKEIEKWASVYEFSFQFWGKHNNNIYISKGGINLVSFGGEESIEKILNRTLDWVKEKNPKKIMAQKIDRCQGCGTPIAKGNDYCGECMCEDDCE